MWCVVPLGEVSLRTSMCSASQPSSRAMTEAMRSAKHFLPSRALPPYPEPYDQISRVSGKCTMYLVSLHGQATSCSPSASGSTDGVDGRDEVAVLTDQVKSRRAHARHDPHVDHDVGRVGDLDAELRDRAAERAHAERHDVHRAAAHRAVEEGAQRLAHLVGGHPVVGGAGILFALGADVGAVLDAGDVLGVGAGQEAVRALLLVQLDEGAGLDQLGGEAVPLLLRAVGPHHPVGLGQGGDLFDPGQQLGVLGGGFGETGNRHDDLFGEMRRDVPLRVP